MTYQITDLSDHTHTGSSTRSGGFLYDGTGYTPEEFAAFVDTYDFGTIPPSFIVLHHTYRPGASWASSGAQYDWDGGEQGMTDAQIYAKRKQRLDNIRHYYQSHLRWDRGPHLFIDDRWIWIMTPMFHVGIHAAEGNGSVAGGYSVGIEVIGYYEHVQWSPAIERNVGIAVAAIKRRLGTFDYVHRAGPGGISSHRDYNKPTCPGAAITERYYIQVLERGWDLLSRLGTPSLPTAQVKPIIHDTITAYVIHPDLRETWERSGGVWQPGRLTPGLPISNAVQTSDGLIQRFERGTVRKRWNGTVEWLLLNEQVPESEVSERKALTPTSPLVSAPTVTEQQVRSFLKKNHAHLRDADVETIVPLWYQTAIRGGIDPMVAFAQLFLETGYLTSYWWVAHRNPAGIGVTGTHSPTEKPGYHYHADRKRYEEGISFPSWTEAASAHIGRLLAYALKAEQNTAQASLIFEALRWRPLPDHIRGAAPTIQHLTGRWAMDTRYHDKLVAVSQRIMEGS